MKGAICPTINCPNCQTEAVPALVYNALGEVLLRADCRICNRSFEEETSFGNMIRKASELFDVCIDFRDFDIKNLPVYGSIH